MSRLELVAIFRFVSRFHRVTFNSGTAHFMYYAILSILLLTITGCSQLRPEPPYRDTQSSTGFSVSKKKQIS